MSKVCTRYAPSPTGIPHIGNIRTALFSYLLAKNRNGKFILRIEDTDQKRSTHEHIAKIEQSLKSLSLDWDEKYLQSERLDIYNKHLKVLIKKEAVYKDQGAWYFKIQTKDNRIGWQDLVHDNVSFPVKVIEDFVAVKSDGFPTYHFASVVDDHLMNVTHVMRGDEWISSTPKHVLLYRAFGWHPPQFVHLPPILGQNHKKLSKREGAKSVVEYLEEGYLPEALINFLALLGWSPKGNQEIFSLDELTRGFSLDRINKNSPIFSIEKLNWMNGKWIRRLNKEEYQNVINKYYPNYDPKITSVASGITQDRVTSLGDYSKIADFFYNQPQTIPTVPLSKEPIVDLLDRFKSIKKWDTQTIKDIIDESSKVQKVDRVELITSVRNIVSGKTVTPPLYESLEILGKEETVRRLNAYLQKK